MSLSFEETKARIDVALNSGEDPTFSLDQLKIFRDTLKRWLKLVDRNIKYLESKLEDK